MDHFSLLRHKINLITTSFKTQLPLKFCVVTVHLAHIYILLSKQFVIMQNYNKLHFNLLHSATSTRNRKVYCPRTYYIEMCVSKSKGKQLYKSYHRSYYHHMVHIKLFNKLYFFQTFILCYVIESELCRSLCCK